MCLRNASFFVTFSVLTLSSFAGRAPHLLRRGGQEHREPDGHAAVLRQPAVARQPARVLQDDQERHQQVRIQGVPKTCVERKSFYRDRGLRIRIRILRHTVSKNVSYAS